MSGSGSIPSQMASGWFTLAGAVLGGAVALISTLFAQRTTRQIEAEKRAREDKTRYNLERVEAYSRFLSLANNLPNVIPADEAFQENLSDVTKARDEMWQAYIKTHLLSSESTRAEARKLFNFAYAYLNAEEAQERQTIFEKWQEEDLTKRFITAAQKELLIPERIDMATQP